MVSRRTRGYKEKKPMAAFGQFMLPLAVIMAIALLYFSMKLFFLSPGGKVKHDAVSVPVTVSEDTRPAVAEPPVPAQPLSQDEPRPAARVTAGPVDAPKPAETLTVTQTAPKAAATPKKPAAAAPTAPATPAKPATPSLAKQSTIIRYDVQIGAFSSRENAVQLAQKARGQGYAPYINEALHNGSPYFRVRVRGLANRAETQALSRKLEEQDYPIYIVEITK